MTEHLPEVPRHTAQGIAMRWQGSDIWGNGVEYVTYADHVTAVAACEARVREQTIVSYDMKRAEQAERSGYEQGRSDERHELWRLLEPVVTAIALRNGAEHG